MLAACAASWCVDAVAQSVQPIPGAIAAPDSDPRSVNRFQSKRAAAVRTTATASSSRFGAPALLEPIPDGAGTTGFDATNTGKKKGKARQKAKTPSPARELIPLQPVMPSGPIGRRPQDSPTAALASASGRPGAPPVELGPIYTQPKKRRAHEPIDPYDPLGIRSGGLLYYPAIEFIAGRNTNPGQVPGGAGATLYTIAPELRVQSDWSRHELKADLRGSYTGYSPDTTPTLSRPYFNGKVDGRVDVTKQDRIDLGARVLVSTDNPGSPNLNVGLSKLPIFTTFGGSAGIAHRFNRLEIGIKGDAERTVYQDSKLTDGTTASNDDRNYNQYGGTLRAGYEFYPGVTPFVEGGADIRKHDVNPDISGFNRESKGITGKVGTTFEIVKVLTGEIAVGYTRRNYDDPQLESLKGLIGNGSLTWTASALTTVKFTASSTVGESTVTGVSGILYRDAGLQIDHAFRRWLIGTVKLGIGEDKYIGSLRDDKRYSAGVGLTYKLNRMVQLKGEVRRDWLRSNVDGVDYTANVFLVGVRLQY